MDVITDILFESIIFYWGVMLLSILQVVFTLLFLNYSAAYRNHKLSVSWYICAVLFEPIALIVYLVKRKDFPSPDAKCCYRCGTAYPESEELCEACQLPLPEINREEKKKQKKFSKIFGAGVILTYLLTFVFGLVLGAYVAKDVITAFEEGYDSRISVNGAFYDKKGNKYEDDEDVILYDEKGRTYKYLVEETEDDELGLTYEEYYYVRNDGEKYFTYDCYVTEDGWFYCDKAYALESYSEDLSQMSEEELDAYYKDQLNNEDEDKYYNYPMVDKKGNLYYFASEASWNEKGELITEKNDISATKD